MNIVVNNKALYLFKNTHIYVNDEKINSSNGIYKYDSVDSDKVVVKPYGKCSLEKYALVVDKAVMNATIHTKRYCSVLCCVILLVLIGDNKIEEWFGFDVMFAVYLVSFVLVIIYVLCLCFFPKAVLIIKEIK